MRVNCEPATLAKGKTIMARTDRPDPSETSGRGRGRRKTASGKPTVYDVAERAGVSIATVSFAFRQPEKVRESTRETVLQAARELGYVPSASARGLAHGSTGTFGMFAYDLLLAARQSGVIDDDGGLVSDDESADPRAFPLYVDEVQRGFELGCRMHGKALLLGRERASDFSMVDIAGRVDGLLVLPGHHEATLLAQIARRIPVVALSHAPGTDPVHHVRVDNRGGMRDVVDHLVTEHGITDIGYVGRLTTNDYAERYAGYNDALLAHGLTPPAGPVDQTDLDEPGHFAELSKLADEGRLPRALVCQSDQLALSLLDWLAERGIETPGTVAVTGFDGILATRLSRPTLTTVRQPMALMGSLAAQILARHVEQPGGEPETHELPVTLLVRESCGCAASSE